MIFEMNVRSLSEMLSELPQIHVLVVGDFFLDKYLFLDRRLSETSLETGLETYQMFHTRLLPGAAGTVAKDLRALDVQVSALSIIGEDGEGYELKRALKVLGVDIEQLISVAGCHTPTYIKPIMRELDGYEHELNRIDIKNREILRPEVEEEVISRLRELVPQVDGVAISDQVEERNCGVITEGVREELERLAKKYPETIFIADSRARIDLFRGVIVKSNHREAALAVGDNPEKRADRAEIHRWGRELQRRSGQPVFLTAAKEGIFVFTEDTAKHIPAVPVEGPIDPVGAGDAVLAGLLSALCVETSLQEAAFVANLIASITIKQLCTTGTATPNQLLARLRERQTLDT